MNNEYQEQQPSLKHLLAMYTNSDIWSVLQTTAVDSLQMKRFCTEMTKFNESHTIRLRCCDHLNSIQCIAVV